jgi:hypothetical protein
LLIIYTLFGGILFEKVESQNEDRHLQELKVDREKALDVSAEARNTF